LVEGRDEGEVLGWVWGIGGVAHEIYGVTQEDESGRVIGEFLGELGEVVVDDVFFGADFFGGLIDEDWRVLARGARGVRGGRGRKGGGKKRRR
jgi:hypothetical protein